MLLTLVVVKLILVSKEFYDAFDVGSSYLMKFHRGLVTTYGVARPDMILDSFEYR